MFILIQLYNYYFSYLPLRLSILHHFRTKNIVKIPRLKISREREKKDEATKKNTTNNSIWSDEVKWMIEITTMKTTTTTTTE